MTNPFSGIITSSVKTLFNNMIDAVLENGALSVPCTLIYGGTTQDCPNCIYDSVVGKSSNQYQAGGPYPFTHGPCPYCNGLGVIYQETSETVYLGVIWDSRDWLSWVGTPELTRTPEMYVQTLCGIAYLDEIRRAEKAIMNTALSNLTRNIFQKYGEPEPLGFGSDDFILTMWERIT